MTNSTIKGTIKIVRTTLLQVFGSNLVQTSDVRCLTWWRTQFCINLSTQAQMVKYNWFFAYNNAIICLQKTWNIVYRLLNIVFVCFLVPLSDFVAQKDFFFCWDYVRIWDFSQNTIALIFFLQGVSNSWHWFSRRMIIDLQSSWACKWFYYTVNLTTGTISLTSGSGRHASLNFRAAEEA